MDFSPAPRRPRAESIVPMINVVFLLLIFFLMTSHLAKPEPFEVTPPTAHSEREPRAELVLYVDQTGTLAYEELRGTEALAALAAAADKDTPVKLRADGQGEAQVMAKLLRDLAAAGLSQVEFVVAQQ